MTITATSLQELRYEVVLYSRKWEINENDNDNDNENNFIVMKLHFHSFIVQEQQHTQQRLFFTCQENIMYNAQGRKWL